MRALSNPRNPLAVLFVTFCLLCPVLLSSDYVTPLAYLVLGILNLVFLGNVDFRSYLKTLSVLSLVSVGLFALNVLAPAEGSNGLVRGGAVFLRSVSLISLSVGYIFAVNPYDLTRALMVRFRLEPRTGFALFAGWNTIPLLRRDLAIIDTAQALRFGDRKRKIQDRARTATALLAGAVRHGERVALSMAARGIEGPGPRTFLKDSPWTLADSLYCAAGFLVSVITAWGIISRGFFVFELG
mgnify:CR=1 FL=1